MIKEREKRKNDDKREIEVVKTMIQERRGKTMIKPRERRGENDDKREKR